MDDYIKRDALLKEISQQKAMSTHSFPRRHFTVNDVLTCIKTAPAADVAPVVHGKWIQPHWHNSVHAMNCSVCGGEVQHAEFRGVAKYYSRCPHCGAKMDLED